MAKKPAPVKLIVAVGAVCLFAYLIISSIQDTRLKYEVCMDFKGASHCSTATGGNATDAIHSAHEIDCELLSNGRDELMVCMDQVPSRITQLK
ncbi:MAG TPA: hypothetical protein VMJ93_10480 [Verrucomicrobiae bacterium]|nr:hypothetical protein [Verrucomicrobiae bacterium]